MGAGEHCLAATAASVDADAHAFVDRLRTGCRNNADAGHFRLRAAQGAREITAHHHHCPRV